MCIYGFHFNEGIDSVPGNYKITVDYRNSLYNIKNLLIKSLIDNGHSVDIILLTYNSKLIESLKNDYNPIKSIILPEQEIYKMNQWQRILYWQITAINEIQTLENNNNIKYDIIIHTRFDLFLHTKFTDLPYDYSKINFSYQYYVPETGKMNSNPEPMLYPRNMINSVYNALNILNNHNRIIHELNHHIDETILHYVQSKRDYSNPKGFGTTFASYLRIRVSDIN